MACVVAGQGQARLGRGRRLEDVDRRDRVPNALRGGSQRTGVAHARDHADRQEDQEHDQERGPDADHRSSAGPRHRLIAPLRLAAVLRLDTP